MQCVTIEIQFCLIGFVLQKVYILQYIQYKAQKYTFLCVILWLSYGYVMVILWYYLLLTQQEGKKGINCGGDLCLFIVGAKVVKISQKCKLFITFFASVRKKLYLRPTPPCFQQGPLRMLRSRLAVFEAQRFFVSE